MGPGVRPPGTGADPGGGDPSPASKLRRRLGVVLRLASVGKKRGGEVRSVLVMVILKGGMVRNAILDGLKSRGLFSYFYLGFFFFF